MTRARKQGILINLNWSDIQNVPSDLGADQVTFENLNANGDVGTGAEQVARGDHDHNVADLTLIFNNNLI